MNPQFITLPSGLRVNTAHILEYRETEPRKTVITQNVVMKYSDGGYYTESITEDMTAEQLDALLNPPSSPIVESVVNLDNLKHGKACQFTYHGEVFHGIIHECGYSEPLDEPWIQILSHGEIYTFWPRDGEVEKG